MIAFPHAKINLGLQVIAKRHDGFHNINTCFYPIGWSDVLEIVKSATMSFTCSGLDIPGDPRNNLCLKGYRLLQERFQLPPVNMHLHKVIPMGAGLGGGSSDGAFTLKLINDLFQLDLSVEQLQQYAAELGSDCPFFIEGKPVLASGRGNEFTPLALSLPAKYLLVVYPPIEVSTAQAYAALTPCPPPKSLEEIIQQPDQWQVDLKNDFEAVVFDQHPEIAGLKHSMIQAGAVYSAMSGSGSSVFGFFDTPPDLETLAAGYSYWSQELSPLD